MSGDFNGFHSERLDDLEKCKICGTLECDYVARPRDSPHREIERLHSAAGNRQIVRGKRAPVGGRPAGDLAPKHFEATGEFIAGAVLGLIPHDSIHDSVEPDVWKDRRLGSGGS